MLKYVVTVSYGLLAFTQFVSGFVLYAKNAVSAGAAVRHRLVSRWSASYANRMNWPPRFLVRVQVPLLHVGRARSPYHIRTGRDALDSGDARLGSEAAGYAPADQFDGFRGDVSHVPPKRSITDHAVTRSDQPQVKALSMRGPREVAPGSGLGNPPTFG